MTLPMTLPSLRIPVLALAGLLAGIGLWYGLILMEAMWAAVVMGAVLILTFEMVLRLSKGFAARMGASDDEEAAAPPRLTGRDRDAALVGLVIGLACGYMFWGPVLDWGTGKGGGA